MKNKILNILKTLGLILLMLIFPIIFFSLLNINPETISENYYITYLSLSNITLIIIYIIIYNKTLLKDIKSLKKDFKNIIKLGFKYWIIGFIIMILSNIIITEILNKPLADNETLVRNYIDNFPLYMLFNTTIYAPIIEELTFRKSIRDAIKNKWLYILLSGLIFGLLHITSTINTPLDLIYLIPYSTLGISFALLYYKTNNIYSVIIFHSMHNLLALITYLLGVSI